MNMPQEVRVGRHVPDSMETAARAVIAAVHARLPLDSARIYRLTPATYRLCVLPARRTTLVNFDFRVRDKVETRTEAVIDHIQGHSDQLDAADARNALPVEIERVVAACAHESGDGAWFRTAVRHAARRTQLCRDGKGVVPAWPEVIFGSCQVMKPDGPSGIKFIESGTPGLVGLKLTLPAGTPVLASFDDAAGMPVDELVDHPLVNGAGLVAAKAWKSETADRALGRITIMVKSDPIALDDAARLVDRMRATNNRQGVACGRTGFRASDPGYELPAGCTPENPNKFPWHEVDVVKLMRQDQEKAPPPADVSTIANADTPAIAIVAKPHVTKERELESLIAFVRSKGLESEWIATLAAEEGERSRISTPEVTVSRQEMEGRRYFNASINITPWLMFAAVEDVVQLINLDFDDLAEGTEDSVFLDGVCDACEGHRDDQDEEYHIAYPDSWDYDVWGNGLRQEIRQMIKARRPEILEQVDEACRAVMDPEEFDMAA